MRLERKSVRTYTSIAAAVFRRATAPTAVRSSWLAASHRLFLLLSRCASMLSIMPEACRPNRPSAAVSRRTAGRPRSSSPSSSRLQYAWMNWKMALRMCAVSARTSSLLPPPRTTTTTTPTIITRVELGCARILIIMKEMPGALKPRTKHRHKNEC